VAPDTIGDAAVCLHCGTVVRFDHPELGVLPLLSLSDLPGCSHGARTPTDACGHPDECRRHGLAWASSHVIGIDGRRVWADVLAPVGVCLHCGRLTEPFLGLPVMRLELP
jgi:hypothetical protein